MTSIGHLIYVIGGIGPTDRVVNDSTEVYNTQKDTWE